MKYQLTVSVDDIPEAITMGSMSLFRIIANLKNICKGLHSDSTYYYVHIEDTETDTVVLRGEYLPEIKLFSIDLLPIENEVYEAMTRYL